MSKHTKGDWYVLSDGLTIMAKIEYEPHYDVEPPQSLIAKCFQNDHLGRTKWPTDEDLANARLIAAAPKLLAACKSGIAPNILHEYLGWAKHMKEAPNLAVYKKQFGALCALLNDLISCSEKSLAAIAAAKGD